MSTSCERIFRTNSPSKVGCFAIMKVELLEVNRDFISKRRSIFWSIG